MGLKKITLCVLLTATSCYLPYDKEKIADYYIKKAKQTYEISLQLKEVMDSLKIYDNEKIRSLKIKKLERKRDSLIDVLRRIYREYFW